MLTAVMSEKKPWYAEPWVWLMISFPLAAVIGGMITIYLAVLTSDGLVVDDYYKRGKAINVDLARDRAKELFGADHANVQPHSGVAANLSVYFAMLDIGDRVLSMKLSHGGHLSHGATASITSRCFDFSHYGVSPKTERIDYDAVASMAKERRPKLFVAGASSLAIDATAS